MCSCCADKKRQMAMEAFLSGEAESEKQKQEAAAKKVAKKEQRLSKQRAEAQRAHEEKAAAELAAAEQAAAEEEAEALRQAAECVDDQVDPRTIAAWEVGSCAECT